MKSPVSQPRTLLLFVLLSLADLCLTWWLLAHSGGDVYEGNPVARWWLTRFGWLGLFAFKAAVVVLVLGLVAVISRHRPQAGRRVLGFGCSAVAVVVLYSSYLCLTVPRTPEEREAAAERAFAEEFAAEDRRFEREFRKSEAHNLVMDRVAGDLVAGRCTLDEGVERATATEKSRDPAWLEMLARIHSARSPRECLACALIRRVGIYLRQDPPAARRIIARLEREFQLAYGNPPPYDPHLLVSATAEDRPDHLARLDTSSDALLSWAPEAEDLPTEE